MFEVGLISWASQSEDRSEDIRILEHLSSMIRLYILIIQQNLIDTNDFKLEEVIPGVALNESWNLTHHTRIS